MIRNLIFDFGKVLVDYDFQQLITQFFSDNDKEAEKEFLDIITSDEFLDQCDLGEMNLEELVNHYTERYPKFSREFRMFNDRYIEFVLGEMPGMRELLTRLKKMGYRLYGLTNWCSVVHEVMRRYGIFDLLDGRVVSSEEKLIKPDPAIYRCLCERYSLKPEECLFTDDKEKNVAGAKSIGMEAVVFTDAETYRKDLARITGNAEI